MRHGGWSPTMTGALVARRTWRFRLATAWTLLRWQPDQWRRMVLVAARVPESARRVLDVGGRGHQMATLLRPAAVTSVNVEPPADLVVAAGEALPYPDATFDVVLSTDVLEHMPAGDRAAHLTELCRVARRRVVLCWPLGSPEKDRAELRLQARLRDELGLTLPFLEEHIRFGLPREDEVGSMIATIAAGSRQSWLFEEGIEAGDALLVDALRARHRFDVLALVRFLSGAYLHRPPLRSASSPDSSRALLVVDL